MVRASALWLIMCIDIKERERERERGRVLAVMPGHLSTEEREEGF